MDSTYEYIRYYINGDTLEVGTATQHTQPIITYDTVVQYHPKTYNEIIYIFKNNISLSVYPKNKFNPEGDSIRVRDYNYWVSSLNDSDLSNSHFYPLVKKTN